MSALTRIFNNQIYNATIVASQKIAPGTITGSLFSSNVTVPGDLLIAGNLFVLGTSAYTTIASTNTYVNDPLVVMNNGFSGTSTYDQGMVFNRGTSQNQAFIWSEFNREFRLIGTTDTGTTYGNVTASVFANLHVGNARVDYNLTVGSLSVPSLNLSGNILAANGTFSGVTVNGIVSASNVTVAGNVTATYFVGNGALLTGITSFGNANVGAFLATYNGTVGASFINSTGNILATAGTFNALTVNGIVSASNVTVAGNVTATQFIGNGALLTGIVSFGNANVGVFLSTYTGNIGAGFINSTGNILATAGTFNALTVNGNETVTGFLNVTGNVLATTVDTGGIEATGVIYANSTLISTTTTSGALQVVGGTGIGGNLNIGTVGAVSGQFHTVRGNITQSTSGGAVYFNTAGNVMAAVGQFGSINSTGNVVASTVLAQLVTADDATFGNVAAGFIGNASTAFAGASINLSGNVLASAMIGASLNVSGNVAASTVLAQLVTADDATFGNVVAGFIGNTGTAFTGAAINLSGNVLAGLAQFAAINSTPIGNASASTGAFTVLAATNNLWANASIATTTQGTGAIVVPNGGISVAGAANIAGAITTAGTAQFNNTITVGGTSSFTNTTNATEGTGSSGALQIKGGASIAKDLHVGGNIYASNIFGTSYQVITVQDPLLYLDAANSFPYNYDIGFYSNFIGPNPIDNTGNVYQHSGLVRDNVDNTWKFFSNVRAEPSGSSVPFNVDTIYDPVRAGNLTLTYTQAATSTTTGALIVAGGAGIAGTVVAGQINSTGNVLGQSGTFNALIVNGNAGVTGYLNVTGNVLATQFIGNGALLTGITSFGNANVGVFLSTYTGNIGAGFINVTGNVLASTVAASFVTASTIAVGNISAVTIGNAGATVTGSTGTFGAVNSGFIGNTGTAFTGSSINVSGNVLAAGAVLNALTVNGNETVTGFLNVTGNVLSTGAVHNALAVNGNTSLGLAGAISGSWTTVIGNITQSTSGGAVYFNTAGNVSAATVIAGQFNTTGNLVASQVSTATLNATGLINTLGNISAAVLNGGAINSTGLINTTGNVSAAIVNTGALNSTGFINTTANISAAVINTGALNSTGFINTTANISAAVVNAGALNATGTTTLVAVNSTGFINTTGNISASRINAATLAATGTIWANATTDTTNISTGAIVAAGGVAVGKTLWVGENAVFNSTQAAEDFRILGQGGSTNNSLVYVNAAKNAMVFGGANVLVQDGCVVKFNSPGAILLPVGASSDRPSSSGNIDVAGMIRFNTTIQNLEYYTGTIWEVPGSGLTVISDRQFAGNVAGGFGNVDGTNTTFTIQANSTTAGTLVSINGVIQFPVLAYAISGTTLTFTEPPAPEDVIDVRVLAPTTVVSSLANDNGLNQYIASNDGLELWTGTVTTTKRVLVNTVGDVNLLTGNKVTYTQTAVNIPSINTPTQIDTWSKTAYTSAKYHVTAKVGATNFETYEALVLTDGAGNAFVTTYGVVNNGTTFGTITADVSGSNVIVKFASTVAQANVKAFGTFIV